MGIWLARSAQRAPVEAHDDATSEWLGVDLGSEPVDVASVDGTALCISRRRCVPRPCTVVAGEEPAARSVGDDGGEGGGRHHDVSILLQAGGGLGRCRGAQPASKVSMITIAPPQQGQGCAGFSIVSVSAGRCGWVSAGFGGVATAMSKRARASVSALARLLAS